MVPSETISGSGVVEVKVIGVEKVLEAIEGVKGWVAYIAAHEPEKVAKELRDRIEQKARSLFRKRTGRLFASIKAHPFGNKGAWVVVAGGAQAPYAIFWEFGWCHHKSGRCFRRPFFYNTAYEYARENNLEFGGGIFPEVVYARFGEKMGGRIIESLTKVGITKRFRKSRFKSRTRVRVRKVKGPRFRIRG